MLITNGTVTRNIDAKRLPEYAAKGYKEVKAKEPKAPKEPKAGEKTDK